MVYELFHNFASSFILVETDEEKQPRNGDDEPWHSQYKGARKYKDLPDKQRIPGTKFVSFWKHVIALFFQLNCNMLQLVLSMLSIAIIERVKNL